MEQESKYFLVREFSRNFRFPHWSLRWAFWLTVVIIPPFLIFSAATRFVYPKTTFWLCIYLLSITGFAGMAAVVNSVLYNRKIWFVDKSEPYHQRYYTAIGVMVPFGAFFLYFTYYLCMIPFTYQPNYVFTLKPSKQLEMELNDLLGADTLEYTPFDYSLDKQEVTYVTDGVSYEYIGMLGNFVSRPEKYVTLSDDDLDYVFAIKKKEPFKLTIIENECFLQAKVEPFRPRVIEHPKFRTPIDISSGDGGEMLVSTLGGFRNKHGKCIKSFPYSSKVVDVPKGYSLEAYIQYPALFSGLDDYYSTRRLVFDYSLRHFDSRISDF